MSAELDRRASPKGDAGDDGVPVAAAVRYTGYGFLLGFLTCAIAAGALTWLLRRPDPPPIVLHPPPTAAPSATPLPTATPGALFIFVSGGVQRPGLYALSAGARVGDALTKAGGLLPGADPALVNQAELLFDGAQIHVPLPGGADPTQAGLSDKPQPPDGASGGGQSGGLININTATFEQLTSLPGIGPSKAQAIIAERPFAAVEDLERVPGIGASTIQKLAPLVTTQ